MNKPKQNQRIIAIVHRGYSWYLPYVLRQARAFNPTANILLFSDRPRWPLFLFCKTVKLDAYFESAKSLEPHFQNFSPNSADYELFCIQRWGVLLDYARKHNIKEIVHLDSDVLVYTDLWKRIDHDWNEFDFILTGWQGPATLFIRNLDALETYWLHMVNAYRNKLSELQQAYEGWHAQGLVGGVSDMHFLHEFVENYGSRFRFGDNSKPKNGAVFDHAANCAEGYAYNGEIKQIKMEHDVPWGLDLATGQYVRFQSLHFQGMSKKFIPQMSTRVDWRMPLVKIMNRLTR